MADNMRERGALAAMTAAQIRAERSAARMSQQEMVERSGISRSQYIRLEQGTRTADIMQIGRICTALNLDMETFVHRVMQRLESFERGEDGVHAEH